MILPVSGFLYSHPPTESILSHDLAASNSIRNGCPKALARRVVVDHLAAYMGCMEYIGTKRV